MAAWPGTLPQKMRLEGFEETAPNQVIRTDMDVGPPKVRRRYTAGIRILKGAVDLTKAQVETLDAFFLTTLKGGADQFTWTHPRTLAAASLRFITPPKYMPHGDPDIWRAQLELEILP